jgi:biotin transport system substrate-specific component
MEARMKPVTLVDALLPSRRVLHDVLLVVAFSVLIAVSARIAIPLPFSPVPVTMQTFSVLITGMLLGSRLGAVTLIAYLAEGVAGLPVFAFGVGGFAALLGPTGGYLVGFIFAAGLVGFLAERAWDRRRGTTFLAMLFGNLVIYAFGVGWLAHFLPFEDAVTKGMLPFLVGDLVKILLAMAVLPAGWTAVSRLKG